MMPKSTTAMRPSSWTKRLPGCRSPWKKPSRKTCLKIASAATVSTRSGSWPAAMIAARSSIGIPAMRSRVRTRRPVRDQSTAGTCRLGSAAKFSASSDAAAASILKSISWPTDSAKRETESTNRSRRRSGRSHSMRSASQKNRSRSRPNARSMPGRSTLTATGRPSVVAAKCTCAIEAAATGVSSKLRNSAVAAGSQLVLDGPRGRSSPRTAATGPAVREIGGDMIAEHVGAGGQRLTELDERRAGRLQRARQLFAGRARRGAEEGAGEHSATARGGSRPSIGRQRVVARQASATSPNSGRDCGRCGASMKPAALFQIRQAECRAAMPPERFR